MLAADVHTAATVMLEERPRERLHQVGADSLATTELVALLLGTGRRGVAATECARELLG